MQQQLLALFSLIFVLSITHVNGRARYNCPDSNAAIPGEYIVTFAPFVEQSFLGTDPLQTNLDDLLSQMNSGKSAQSKAEATRFRYLRMGGLKKVNRNALDLLVSSDFIDLVECNMVVTTSAYALPANRQTALWGLDRITTSPTGLDGKAGVDGITGANVHAFVLDTGIRASHTQFRQGPGFVPPADTKLAAPGGIPSRVAAINATAGSQCFSGSCSTSAGNPADGNGHGTHVSGTIGGLDFGVAPNVILHAIQVLTSAGSGSYTGVISGVDYVKQAKIAHRDWKIVASMSLSGPVSQALTDAITQATNEGVIVCVAAGNNNADASSFSPGNTPVALTVGAIDITGSRASYSNYGSVVDVFAPGSAVLSAWSTSDTATNTISGTSMATPHVSGVTALYLGTLAVAPNSQADALAAQAAILDESVLGVVTNAGPGSPNLLLYFPCPSSSPCCNNGQVVLSGQSCGNGLCGTCNGLSEINYTSTCPPANPAVCSSYQCNAGQCDSTLLTSGTCTPAPADQQQCTTYSCNTDSACVPDGFLDQGTPCSLSAPLAQCKAYQCGAAGSCDIVNVNGGSCQGTDPCKVYSCVSGACVASGNAPNGGTCTLTCKSGSKCNNGVCSGGSNLKTGTVCTKPNGTAGKCKTGSCV